MRLLLLCFFLLTSCTADDEKKELKSPCVSAPTENAAHPCGPRIRVNERTIG